MEKEHKRSDERYSIFLRDFKLREALREVAQERGMVMREMVERMLWASVKAARGKNVTIKRPEPNERP